MRMAPVLSVEGVSVTRGGQRHWFGGRQHGVRVVDDVSFEIRAGEAFGVVGESGCGKTTLALAILRLLPLESGRVVFQGADLLRLSEGELRRVRPRLQVVFQDPYASLHPRKTIEAILSEPYELHTRLSAAERRHEIENLLERVGLGTGFAARTARECSGGQRQRIAIARALALRPRLIVLDEPVSALDVSIRAQIMELLSELQRDLGLTYLFIAHDLALVRTFCQSIAVMYLGRLVETGPCEVVLDAPAHPYTRSLLAAVPIPDPEIERRRPRLRIQGEIGSLLTLPPGCRFQPRCPRAEAICEQLEPALEQTGDLAHARCHFWRDVKTLPSEFGVRQRASGNSLRKDLL